MDRNLGAARRHLEAAFECLSGDDQFSDAARDAVSMLIDSIITLEHRPRAAKVLPFSREHRRDVVERKRSVNHIRSL